MSGSSSGAASGPFFEPSLILALISLVSGGTIQGLISDFMGKRAPVVVVSLLLAIGALWGYSREYKRSKKIGTSVRVNKEPPPPPPAPFQARPTTR